MTKKKDDEPNLLDRVFRPPIDSKALDLIFDDAPDNKDGAEARKELKRICRRERNRFNVPGCYSEEDLYQDVSLRFWKSLRDYRGEAKLRTLIHRIAFNQLVDMRRKGWQKENSEATLRKDDEELDQIERLLAPKENVNTAEDAALKRIYRKELLSTLPEKDYLLFRAHYVYGHTAEEIARESGVSRQAISKRLTRIVRNLKRIDDASSQDSELSDFSDVVTQ